MKNKNEHKDRQPEANPPEADNDANDVVGNKGGPTPNRESADHTATPIIQPNLAANADTPPDPFSPDALRLSQDFVASLGVKKVLTTISCRKPNPHEFFRVRPGEDWQLATGVFEDKINREVFLVQRDLWTELAGEVRPVQLALAANRQNDVFVWGLKLPGPDGRTNAWYDSALAAAKLAEVKWVRMTSNMTGGMYDVFEAAGELSEPVWPDLSFSEILKLCFKDRFIQDVNHPVVRALRGLA